MNEIFIRCACGAEGINITQDEDTGEVFFAMMYNNPCRMSVMDKLRWIIRILMIGKPYPDQIVVAQEWLPLLIDHLKAMQKCHKADLMQITAELEDDICHLLGITQEELDAMDIEDVESVIEEKHGKLKPPTPAENAKEMNTK